MKVPDPPQELTRLDTTSINNIEFTWQTGGSDGGTVIEEYTIFYDISGLDRYRTLRTDKFEDKTFSTTTLFPLTGLNQISFKVSAKNAVGISSQSAPIHFLRKWDQS